MTYSFIALAPSGQVIGIAVASYSLAVGAGVPALDPAVGAVVSQAWTNRLLRHRVLDGMRSGVGTEAALASALAQDDGREQRQVAALSVRGEVATWTGAQTSAWSGHRDGGTWVATGNLLAGERVLEAMAQGYLQETGDSPVASQVEGHAWRLLRALEAGQGAGGDRRGRQSCALLVAPTQSDSIWPPQLQVDLRVDNSSDPLGDLAAMLALRLADPG